MHHHDPTDVRLLAARRAEKTIGHRQSALLSSLWQMTGAGRTRPSVDAGTDCAWAAAWPKRERLTTAVTDLLLEQMQIAAMVVGVSDHVWTAAEIVELSD